MLLKLLQSEMRERLKEYLRTMQHKLTRFTGTTDVRMSIFGRDKIIQPEEVEISVIRFSISRPPSKSRGYNYLKWVTKRINSFTLLFDGEVAEPVSQIG